MRKGRTKKVSNRQPKSAKTNKNVKQVEDKQKKATKWKTEGVLVFALLLAGFQRPLSGGRLGFSTRRLTISAGTEKHVLGENTGTCKRWPISLLNQLGTLKAQASRKDLVGPQGVNRNVKSIEVELCSHDSTCLL